MIAIQRGCDGVVGMASTRVMGVVVIDQRMGARVASLIEKGERVKRTGGSRYYEGFGDVAVPVDNALLTEWRSQSLTLLQQLLGAAHQYVRSFEDESGGNTAHEVRGGIGILRAVKEDIDDGFLSTLRELVHADLFDDFLAMAEHLVQDGGYKDAAAVLAGSTLEEHIRKLCDKHAIPTTTTKPNGSAEPRKASAMNDDLKQQSVYPQPEWRSVQGWLDLRNEAAHGHYDKYTQPQVELMIAGIRGFFLRRPA